MRHIEETICAVPDDDAGTAQHFVYSFRYTQNNVLNMALDVLDMIDLCEGSENKHLKWFGRMLENHFDGIIAHMISFSFPI